MELPPLYFAALPYDLQFYIMAFLPAKELLFQVAQSNRHCRGLITHPHMWQTLQIEQHGKNTTDIFIKKEECLVERRSKGKVYRGVHRIT